MPGDSRLYLLRGGSLRLLTFPDELTEKLREEGVLLPEEALASPLRGRLTAWLGMPEPRLSHGRVELEDGDLVALLSDGALEGGEERIARLLAGEDLDARRDRWCTERRPTTMPRRWCPVSIGEESMLSELRKLRELGRLLKAERFAEVLVFARDPEIADHRRAKEAVEKARAALMLQARRRSSEGAITEALHDVKTILSDGEDTAVLTLERSVREAMVERERSATASAAEIERARALLSAGRIDEALARLEPLVDDDPGARSFVEMLRRHQDDARAAREAAENALSGGDLEQARHGLAEARALEGAAPELEALHARLIDLARKQAEPARLAAVLAETEAVGRGGDSEVAAARARGAQRLLDLAEKRLADEGEAEAAAWLAVFPLDVAADGRAEELARALRRLERARRLFAEGDLRMGEELASEAIAVLPRSKARTRWLEEMRRREGAAKGQIEVVRELLGRGRLLDAKKELVELLGEQPDHAEAQELLRVLERREDGDRESLEAARQRLKDGAFTEARELLTDLELRRPDLDEVPVLLHDAERRAREARLKALEAESRLLAPGLDQANLAQAARGLHEARNLAAGGPAFQDAARRLEALGRPGLDAGRPFILRVEEQGDWLVHPEERLVVGNQMRGHADLPILAAIASRHVEIHRVPDEAAEDAIYRLVPTRDRTRDLLRPVSRNRKPVEEAVDLHHGDVIGLGDILKLTFLKPIPGNASAVLRLHGDFTVHGCARVILFAETGRAGSVVVGPGPLAHVDLGAERDRLELMRSESAEGALLARSRRGVSQDDEAERPQVRVRPAVPVAAGNVRLFVDPVG